MSYRDDRDADRARIEALEQELAKAKAKVDELEGKRSQALVLTSAGGLTPSGKAASASAKWAGAPFRLELAHSWDKEFPIEKFEDLLDVIREVTRDNGRVEMLQLLLDRGADIARRAEGAGTALDVALANGRKEAAAVLRRP